MSSQRASVKQRFNIIGNNAQLNTAIDVAVQVAPTEVTVLVIGENGTGKDVFSKIIHQYGKRKHKQFIAINCGAIPEGTIDSELFGHEKGSFTSAYESRKGYFEESNGGVIFLDEIAETPMPTQARLLRILESGEYLRVGSSKVQKTDVRVIAATNKNLVEAIRQNKFREDLYFRLNTVTIQIPPLRDRGEDIELLFRYFASEFGARYGRLPIQLRPNATSLLHEYHWPGNIREMRNFVEKLSVLTTTHDITSEILMEYLPTNMGKQLVVSSGNNYSSQANNQYNHRFSGYEQSTSGFFQNGHNPQLGISDNELILQSLVDLRKDMADIKALIATLLQHQLQNVSNNMVSGNVGSQLMNPNAVVNYNSNYSGAPSNNYPPNYQGNFTNNFGNNSYYPSPYSVEDKSAKLNEPIEINPEEPEVESFSLDDNEKMLIIKALQKHQQNRKKAANELGVSERTLYRKIKAYELE